MVNELLDIVTFLKLMDEIVILECDRNWLDEAVIFEFIKFLLRTNR